MAWVVEHTAEFQVWWMTLSEGEQIAVARAVEVLEEKGPALARPFVDTLAKDSRHANMKELRVQHAGRPYRVLFAFDPRQVAILFIGGCKSGKRWYESMVAEADGIYDRYLREIKREGLI